MKVKFAILALGLLTVAALVGCGGSGGGGGSMPVTVNINGLAEHPKAAVLDLDSNDNWITLTSTSIPRPPDGWYDVDFTLPLPHRWDGATYSVVIYNDTDHDNHYDSPDELLGFMDHFLEYYDYWGHWIIAENGTVYEANPERNGVYISCDYERALRSAPLGTKSAQSLDERNKAEIQALKEAKTHRPTQ